MKKLQLLTCAAFAGALFSVTSAASAGTITINAGPSFTPGGIVVNNVSLLQPAPELIKLVGNATITQPENVVTTVTLDISGTFTINSGDIASLAYNFNIMLDSDAPATFTITGNASLLNPFPLALPPITTGPQAIAANSSMDYSGAKAGDLVSPFTGSGIFSAQLRIDFGPGTMPGDTLTIIIPNDSIDFQVAPTAIPEPSTYALLVTGLGALVVRYRRRKAA